MDKMLSVSPAPHGRLVYNKQIDVKSEPLIDQLTGVRTSHSSIGLERLPPEIIGEILNYLPIRDVMNLVGLAPMIDGEVQFKTNKIEYSRLIELLFQQLFLKNDHAAKLIIEMGLNQFDLTAGNSSDTLLVCAVKEGRNEIVDLLFEKNKSLINLYLHMKSSILQTAFYTAILYKNSYAFDKIFTIPGFREVWEIYEKEKKIFLFGVESSILKMGDFEALQKSDLGRTFFFEKTALYHEFATNKIGITYFLAQLQNIQVDCLVEAKKFALMQAIDEGNFRTIGIILSSDYIDWGITRTSGFTSQNFTTERNCLYSLTSMIEHGIDDTKGNPFHPMAIGIIPASADFKSDMIELLLNRRSDRKSYVRYKYGRTPLHIVAKALSEAGMKDPGLDINVHESKYNTPWNSAQKEYFEANMRALNTLPDIVVNICNEQERPPLNSAKSRDIFFSYSYYQLAGLVRK